MRHFACAVPHATQWRLEIGKVKDPFVLLTNFIEVEMAQVKSRQEVRGDKDDEMLCAIVTASMLL